MCFGWHCARIDAVFRGRIMVEDGKVNVTKANMQK